MDTENPDYYDGKSSVVWLDYMGTSAIFMGDETTETETKLMREDEEGLLDIFGVDLRSTEIVKVGHHGSAYSTSLEFLQYLHASVAVVSCGENNPYGHPTQETLARLFAMEVDVWRTDRDGHVVVTVSADGSYKTRKIK